MKKSTVFLLIIFVLSLASVYVFIPGTLEVAKIEYVKCNVHAAFRIIGDGGQWGKWLPSGSGDVNQTTGSRPSYFFAGYTYRPGEPFYNALEVRIEGKNTSIKSRIELIKTSIDSTIMVWKYEMPSSLNPVQRIMDYQQARQVKKGMSKWLSALKVFLENGQNIYGTDFHETMSKDSTMVAIKSLSTQYPSTSEIYKLVSDLKKYIALNGAKENNFPMLHVRKLESALFETMVAIPVNKKLSGKDEIFFSRFVPWKVLTAEVRGGNSIVEEALRQMKLYISDYEKTVMAIPFESLVTDRSKEPDTLKWITRIYVPVP